MSCLLQCHDFWVSLINNFPGFLFYYLTFFTICFFPPSQPGPNGMLDDWEENLAIITANRTKGDDLVITHLGDCLWKEKNEVCIINIIFIFRFSFHTFLCICSQVPYTQCIQVAAAHSCYLVAELNIDLYSESARLCLIGADHLKCPRTFASPEAIQV